MRSALVSILMVAAGSACAAQTPAGGDSLNARLRVAIRTFESGNRDSAYRLFDSFIDSYNNANGHLNSRELTAVGIALRYLGVRDPQLFRDALKAFDEAVAADARNIDARVQSGQLLLEKYNSADAMKAFEEALRVAPGNADALVGMAMTLDFDHRPGAIEAARKALAANARHVMAHSFLTHAFLATDVVDSARVHASAALQADATSVDALIAAAAVEQVTGNRTAVAALRSRLPANANASARFDVSLAELSVDRRQYAEAVRLARLAVAADSMAWRGWSVLGINQLRLGDVAGARASLEKAFAGDPYNVWVKNTLDLLDRLEKFETRRSSRFILVASARDVDVLTPYATALAEEAFTKLAQRYRYTPPTPVRIELFDRNADFSVRTVGLAGLGALGVSFGSVLAMDAPSARERGSFNWGSTLWHELAHAFHLGMTGHRVPRWFTEGLAVLEERRAREGWGEQGLPLFIRAAQEKKLLPLADLNNGFVRPTYPQQVMVSYYQASLVLELIEQKHGEAAMRDLLQAYARGLSTASALRDVLKTSPEALDRDFAQFVQQRVGDANRLKTALEAKDYDGLTALGTTAALERAIYIWPYDIALHARLAERYEQAGDWKGAIRARQTIVALQPVDMAEARYQLALAHYRAGDARSARREVLRALETAPNFERAQDLLLKLSTEGRR